MAENITSTKNERIKALRALNSRAQREAAGLFLVEGEKAVGEALSCLPDAVETVVATEEYAAAYSAFSSRLLIVPQFVIEHISEQKSPQGVLASVRISGIPARPSDRAVLLEGVADPSNVGAIMRSADAFKFSRAVLVGCADLYSPKAVRASMGSVFRVSAEIFPDIASACEMLHGEGYTILATSLRGETHIEPQRGRFAVAIGNESRGISRELEGLADKLIKIPMDGETESLNAAVAAGITLYVTSRREF